MEAVADTAVLSVKLEVELRVTVPVIDMVADAAVLSVTLELELHDTVSVRVELELRDVVVDTVWL